MLSKNICSGLLGTPLFALFGGGVKLKSAILSVIVFIIFSVDPAGMMVLSYYSIILVPHSNDCVKTPLALSCNVYLTSNSVHETGS